MSINKDTPIWLKFAEDGKILQDAIVLQSRRVAGWAKPSNLLAFHLLGGAYAIALGHGIRVGPQPHIDSQGLQLIECLLICDTDISGDENLEVFKSFWDGQHRPHSQLAHCGVRVSHGWYLSSKSGGPMLEIVRPADYESVKSWPQVGVSTTAQLGEQMIKTYTVAAMPAVRLTSAVRHIANYSDSLRMALDIDPTTLELAALDQQKGSYFPAPKGIRLAYEKKGAFPDPETLTGGLYLSADGSWSVYWCARRQKTA